MGRNVCKCVAIAYFGGNVCAHRLNLRQLTEAEVRTTTYVRQFLEDARPPIAIVFVIDIDSVDSGTRLLHLRQQIVPSVRTGVVTSIANHNQALFVPPAESEVRKGFR